MDLNRIYNENCLEFYAIMSGMAKPKTDEHKQKISEALRAAHAKKKWGFEKNNDASRMTGKKHSIETRRILSEQKKVANPMKRAEVRRRVSQTRIEKGIGKGEANWNWKGGITPEHVKIRNCVEYKTWRRAVFERDLFTCQDCNAHGANAYLNAHHLKSFTTFPEARFDVDNGVTLCRKCHKARHRNDRTK